jgi:hypothetical protein
MIWKWLHKELLAEFKEKILLVEMKKKLFQFTNQAMLLFLGFWKEQIHY